MAACHSGRREAWVYDLGFGECVIEVRKALWGVDSLLVEENGEKNRNYL